jgi:hypothetical protein
MNAIFGITCIFHQYKKGGLLIHVNQTEMLVSFVFRFGPVKPLTLQDGMSCEIEKTLVLTAFFSFF